MFGINPFTRNFSSIFRALPRRERDYFNAFAAADTEEERKKVLQMVPSNERDLYVARWKLSLTDELRRAKKADILTEGGYDIAAEAADGQEAVEQYRKVSPDVVTMDICMPNKSGIEAIKDINNIDPDAKILVCSALGQELLVMEAIQAGAKDFIVKPFKKEKIIETLEKVISS